MDYQKKQKSLTVLLTNHALPKHSIQTEKVKVTLTNASGKCSATAQRIDEKHANAKKAWLEMGKPEYLSPAEIEYLIESSTMKKISIECVYRDSKNSFEITMPPHSVSSSNIAI